MAQDRPRQRGIGETGNGARRVRRPRTTIVLDTGILYAVAAPYEVEEFREFQPADYVVPAKVLWELDRLVERTETRDRARSALNVLKALVQRGAATKAVSCGGGCTIRIASLQEQSPQPGLDAELADDCILSVGIRLANERRNTKLATTDFALYAKAAAAGVDGLYLERYAETKTVVTRRERESFRSAWQRLQSSDSPGHACRRAINFLNRPLVKRVADMVRERREPEAIFSIINSFDQLASVWTPEVDLYSVLKSTLGIDPPPGVDYSSEALVNQPAVYGFGSGYQHATKRRETPEERVLRIRAAENWRRALNDRIVDIVLSWLEEVREYVLDQVGEDLE